jgi:putative transposase
LTYLRLLGLNLKDARVRLLAWCLMNNHIHLVAIADQEDSLAVLLRRVHGRYAQYYNARTGRSGHLWQNRYYACALDWSREWTALAYVEKNALRAGIVGRAEEYEWSSAVAHVAGHDDRRLLDMAWWGREGPRRSGEWAEMLNAGPVGHPEELVRCTYAGRPFGTEAFVERMSARFGRCWTRGRPPKAKSVSMATVASGAELCSEGWFFPA